MVSTVALCCLVSGLVVGPAWGDPVPLQSDSPHPLTLVSDLTSRLGSHPSRLQDAARLSLPSLPSLPSSQDLEAIKKVSQILVMLGQQLLPATSYADPVAYASDNGVVKIEDLKRLMSNSKSPGTGKQRDARDDSRRSRSFIFVIPAIIGEPVAPGNCDTVASGGDVETPNDPVNIDRQS